ncbi:MAG: S-methyl-5-thioribose-1-phosphate isomerase [Acidobacteria bacterium]|nr:S-methyl-5-thioribose-1-phosphate isomerase [Acidobacteriota bacterium]
MAEPLLLKGKRVFVLDQRHLPQEKIFIEIKSAQDGFTVIKDMVVRGAPLIGVVAYYALAIEAKKEKNIRSLLKKADELSKARPTAVNLKFACDLFKKIVKTNWMKSDFDEIVFEKAKEFHRKEVESTVKMAKNGLQFFGKKSRVLTYCNAGSLATTGYGTALGIIKYAYEKGKIKEVFSCETRPYLQGLRITAFELEESKIPYKVICDNAAGHLMKGKMIDAVVVGADRIASNGDTANKIGTYTLAVLAKENKIPFYVAAPMSTIDFSIKNGDEIKIEEREGKEIYDLLDKNIFKKSYKTLYYGFDVTPAKYITAIITDKGVVSAPYFKGLRKLKRDE